MQCEHGDSQLKTLDAGVAEGFSAEAVQDIYNNKVNKICSFHFKCFENKKGLKFTPAKSLH